MSHRDVQVHTSHSGGVGFAGLLFITFLVLKLTHVIKWSWVWVTAPLWVSAILGVIMLVLTLAIFLTVGKRFR